MTQSVLFICNMNSVRSPMAAALLRRGAGEQFVSDSAGIYEGGLDPFVELVMQEIDVELNGHEPKSLEGVDLSAVDCIIALTPEAAVKVREIVAEECIEFWDIENPSEERGGRTAIMDAYRRVRDDLEKRIRDRFLNIQEKP